MTDSRDLIRLVQTARGLEAGGYNGLAKLMWSLAYSAEIQASNAAGIPRGAALESMLAEVLESLKTGGADATIISALEKGWNAVREDRTIPYTDIPDVYVSRTSGALFLGEPAAITPGGESVLGLRLFRGVWYLDALSPAQVLAALEDNPTVIQQQIAGLSSGQFAISPAAGEWTMHQLLAHLLMAQELLSERIDLLLTQDNPNLAARAVWAQKDRESLSAGEVLERYLDSRQTVLARLKALPAADWWRAGWHNEFGAQTVLSQATYFARHEMSHLPQFAQIRRAIEG